MTAITIGPSFFKKEFKDYSNWQWAYIREALQNCFDAPRSHNVNVAISQENGNTTITFSNDGETMDRDTIVNKLLSLGESGKNFVGSVGGFGKAKVLLYFAQSSYTIKSGNHVIKGEGGHYNIEQGEHYPGTSSTVVIEGESKNQLENALLRFCRHAQWDGTVTYDGKHLETNQHKGTFRRELSFGRVYTNPNVRGAVCRIHGIPMFIDTYCTDRGVIIELNGNSGTTLTSNRDMLVYTYRNELSQFTKMLNTDATKALSVPNPTITHYPGLKCHINKKGKQSEVGGIATAAKTAQVHVSPSTLEQLRNTLDQLPTTTTEEAWPDDDFSSFQSESEPERQQEVNRLGFNFYIRNETRLAIPNHFLPTQMSEYATKLSTIWANVLLTMHEILETEGQSISSTPSQFSVGFVFSQDTEALYHKKDGEVTYLLNPCKIAQDKTGTRFKKRFLLTEKERIISIAVHEIVHALGFEYHDEDYACKLTDLFALAMKNRTKFNACFRV